MTLIQVASLFGLALSGYALHVESQVDNPMYTPGCDVTIFGFHASCTKVFKSEQGHMLSYFGLVPHGHALDVPNAIIGICFYLFALVLPWCVNVDAGLRRGLMKLAAVAAAVSSAWLATVLHYVLHDFCVVCVSTYVVNAVILYSALFRGSGIGGGRKAKSS